MVDVDGKFMLLIFQNGIKKQLQGNFFNEFTQQVYAVLMMMMRLSYP